MVVDRPRVNVHAAEPTRDDLNTAAQASAAPCEAVEDHPGGECLCAACVPHSGESATRSPKPSGRSGRRLRRAMSEASFDSCRTSLQRSRHADRLRAPALSGARAERIPWRTPTEATRKGADSGKGAPSFFCAGRAGFALAQRYAACQSANARPMLPASGPPTGWMQGA